MQSTPIYYADDITLMPVVVIWRMVSQGSLLTGLPVFLYFLVRKVLRLRHPANYAAARPDVLSKITREAVPSEVLCEMTPDVETCQAAGFTVVTWTHPDIIGNKQSYAVMMLHESGLVSATVVWFRISLGDQVRRQTVFSCQSFDESGTHLCTGPVANRQWIPELIPPDTDAVQLDIDTTASETIEAHFNRISGRDDLVRFNDATLEKQVLSGAQSMVDFMIKRRFYVPITAAEYERLSAMTEQVMKTILMLP